MVSALEDLDRQEDEELIAAAAATEGRKLVAAGRGKGRYLAEMGGWVGRGRGLGMIKTGFIKWDQYWGGNQRIQILWHLRHFPYNSTLFGLVME